MSLLTIADKRGGRNGSVPPWQIGERECAEALNVDWFGATLARKRGGADAIGMTASPFTGKVSFLFRHVPGTDETLAELWGVDDALNIGRLAGGTSWAAATSVDSLTGNGWDVTGASLNGKLFVSFASAQGRLHVYDQTVLGALNYLLVGGGGGGGFDAGGGGGGGDMLAGRDTVTAQAYAITIGAGGAGGASNGAAGGTGLASTFNAHSAAGGGGGGSALSGGGVSGASGGGGAGNTSNTSAGNGTGTAGHNGGVGFISGSDFSGGGGGGALDKGAAAVAGQGGNGGAGAVSFITGSSVTYAGGGGGGGNSGFNLAGAGGAGGGGNGSISGAGTAGTANTGGGGGGSRSGGGSGGVGGSGIVIVSYQTGSLTATGGSITTSGGNTIHSFTTSGTFTVTAVKPAIRRAGLAAPSAPTVANTGSGSYAGTIRYYRQRVTTQASGITIYRSEPSASVSFTPSGSGTAARVTQGTLPGEIETHWEVEASPDNANFFLLATVAIGTTTSDDTTAVSGYSSGTASAVIGTYTVQKSYKFVAADQGRLLGFGSYTSTDKQDTIEYSAVVGSLNIGDAERVPTANTITLDENDSGAPTGLVGPMNGSFFAFKDRQTWKLTPTGVTTNPYSQFALSKVLGCVGAHAACVAEDEGGRPALYWMSHRGPYRYGVRGLEYIGHGVEDLILPDAALSVSVMNLAAARVIGHTVFHPDKRQVWFSFATGASDDPDTKIVWNIGREEGVENEAVPSGWARHTGPSAAARCSCLFSKTIGASMSKDLKPHVGVTGSTNTIWRLDSTTTNDAGTNFQAYVDDKVRLPWGLGMNGTINRSHLLAKAGTGVTIRQTLTPDYGAATATTSDVLLTPAGSETRVQVRFTDAGIGDIGAVQARWGDSAAVSNAWALDGVVLEWTPSGPR